MLYAAAGWNPNGVQIWRSASGNPLTWTKVVTAGLGTDTNIAVTGFSVFRGQLYAAVESFVDKASIQVWRTANGTS